MKATKEAKTTKVKAVKDLSSKQPKTVKGGLNYTKITY